MKSINKKQGLIDDLIIRLNDDTQEVEPAEIISLLTDYAKDLELIKVYYIQAKIKQLSRLEKDIVKIFEDNQPLLNEDDYND